MWVLLTGPWHSWRGIGSGINPPWIQFLTPSLASVLLCLSVPSMQRKQNLPFLLHWVVTNTKWRCALGVLLLCFPVSNTPSLPSTNVNWPNSCPPPAVNAACFWLVSSTFPDVGLVARSLWMVPWWLYFRWLQCGIWTHHTHWEKTCFPFIFTPKLGRAIMSDSSS